MLKAELRLQGETDLFSADLQFREMKLYTAYIITVIHKWEKRKIWFMVTDFEEVNNP